MKDAGVFILVFKNENSLCRKVLIEKMLTNDGLIKMWFKK